MSRFLTRMIHLLIATIVIPVAGLSSIPTHAQDLSWAKRAGGASNDVGSAIAVDGNGNSYVTGQFRGSATFGAGEPNETTLTSAGADDIFVAKYDDSGLLLWATRAGGATNEFGQGIAVDGSGASYVTGYFDGSATFGAGEPNETMLTSIGADDIFVAKYDTSGMLLWATRAGGAISDRGLAIAVDDSGNSLVTGFFLGSATFGAGEPNETTLTNAGVYDIFIARYDASGVLLWAKSAGGAGGERGLAIAVDDSGNSYATGYFLASATFGAGEPNETTLTSAASTDIFVAKYEASGMLLWATSAGGADDERGLAIAVDGSGNSYVTGRFRLASATFGAGESNETTLTSEGASDIFVAKYDASGMLLWARRDGGEYDEYGLAIAVDGSGSSYVTGYLVGSANFGAGEPKGTWLTSAGAEDIFVAKYDASGELSWARRAGGVGNERGLGIAVDDSNSYVTGYFQGSAPFGAGEPNETTLTSAGASDIFVAKMTPIIHGSTFQVTMVSPANASPNVTPDSMLNVNFGQSVDANTINAHTFTAYGYQTGIYTGAYTSTLASAQFSASQNFKPGEEIVVTLNASVLATDGTPLTPYSWGFHTAAMAGTSAFYDSGQALGDVDSRDVALGDLDGDGDLDAFVVNQGSPAVPIPNEVWLNDGAGVFVDSGQRLGNSPSYSVALGDLDRDGDLDAFVTNYGYPDKAWLNDGMGVFADSGQELGENDVSRAVALTDVDSDGDLDAFVTTTSHSTNKLWLNNGAGVFTQGSQSVSIPGSSAGMVAFGDLDNDGDLDLFVPYSVGNAGASQVWLNDGRGIFSDSGQNLGGSSHVGVALGDLDADGDLDAYAINFWREPNEVWLNDGSASFTDSGQRLGDSSSVGIALGDVDHDGDLDAFVSNGETSDYASNKVWLNDGSAHFSDSGQNLGAEVSSRMALGDLDGNGSLDALVTNLENSPANKVWLNAQGIIFLPIVQQ